MYFAGSPLARTMKDFDENFNGGALDFDQAVEAQAVAVGDKRYVACRAEEECLRFRCRVPDDAGYRRQQLHAPSRVPPTDLTA
jgi:hypothetical protein